MKLIFFGFFFSLFLFANAQSESETVNYKIKVHFHCAKGKALLENRLNAHQAIESAVADLETKIVTLKYNPDMVTEEYIIDLIEKIGYYTEFSDKSKKIEKACDHDDDDHKDGHDH